MKKRTISLFLSLIMVALLCPSAFAHTNFKNTETLTRTSLNETKIDIYPKEDSPFLNELGNACVSMPEEDDESIQLAAEIRNSVSIRSVTIYPLVVCIETQEVYRVNAVKRSKFWNVSTQSDSLALNSAAVTAFANEALTWLSKQEEYAPYTWGVIGWNLESEIDLAAQKPRRVEFKPYYPQSNEVFETTTKAVSSQYSTLHLSHNFAFPKDPSEYYYIGFTGAFYFTYASGVNSGKEGGLMLGSGARMNSRS